MRTLGLLDSEEKGLDKEVVFSVNKPLKTSCTCREFVDKNATEQQKQEIQILPKKDLEPSRDSVKKL